MPGEKSFAQRILGENSSSPHIQREVFKFRPLLKIYLAFVGFWWSYRPELPCLEWTGSTSGKIVKLNLHRVEYEFLARRPATLARGVGGQKTRDISFRCIRSDASYGVLLFAVDSGLLVQFSYMYLFTSLPPLLLYYIFYYYYYCQDFNLMQTTFGLHEDCIRKPVTSLEGSSSDHYYWRPF